MALVRLGLRNSGSLILTQIGQTFSNEVAEGLGFFFVVGRIKTSDFPGSQNQIWHPKQIQFHLHQLLIDSQNQFKGNCGQPVTAKYLVHKQHLHKWCIILSFVVISQLNKVKNMTSFLQQGVSLWGEQRSLWPCSISIKGFDFCSVKSSQYFF